MPSPSSSSRPSAESSALALTAPYMHDGVYWNLDEAVRHHLDPEGALRSYAGVGLPPDLQAEIRVEANDAIAAAIDPEVRPLRPLSEDEVWSLVFFLQSLSSQTELSVGPDTGVPSGVPSGLPVEQLPSFGGDDLRP